MIVFFIYLRMLIPAAELGDAICSTKDSKHLSTERCFEYAFYMVAAGEETGVDPWLMAAVMWHESRFKNLSRNRTNDYGLMQVHWQKLNVRVGETWLVGLSRADLLDPQKNILAGARELAHKRRFCRRRGHSQDDHYWWGHYKWGIVVRSPKYGRRILLRFKKLQRSRDSNRTS